MMQGVDMITARTYRHVEDKKRVQDLDIGLKTIWCLRRNNIWDGVLVQVRWPFSSGSRSMCALVGF